MKRKHRHFRWGNGDPRSHRRTPALQTSAAALVAHKLEQRRCTGREGATETHSIRQRQASSVQVARADAWRSVTLEGESRLKEIGGGAASCRVQTAPLRLKQMGSRHAPGGHSINIPLDGRCSTRVVIRRDLGVQRDDHVFSHVLVPRAVREGLLPQMHRGPQGGEGFNVVFDGAPYRVFVAA